MEIIITPEKLKEHKVSRYSFKNFDLKSNAQVAEPKEIKELAVAPKETAFSKEELLTLEVIKNRQAEDGGMVANLVKKVEEFGDSVIKLQMRLEKQEEDFAVRLEEEKKRAYEDGVKAGEKSVEGSLVAEVETKKAQLAESLGKLDSAMQKFDKHAISLEKELSSIAVEIAEQVIAKEVREDGVLVAKALARELLEEVKDANLITIKVHPELESELKKVFADDTRIKLVSDRAVSYGGVVIVSDSGNIDAQIKNRFLAVKSGILAGGAG